MSKILLNVPTGALNALFKWAKKKIRFKNDNKKVKEKKWISMRTKNYFGTMEAHSEKHKGKKLNF